MGFRAKIPVSGSGKVKQFWTESFFRAF